MLLPSWHVLYRTKIFRTLFGARKIFFASQELIFKELIFASKSTACIFGK
jgi:hypothetical protein